MFESFSLKMNAHFEKDFHMFETFSLKMNAHFETVSYIMQQLKKS